MDPRALWKRCFRVILTLWKWVTTMRNFIFDSFWYFELAKCFQIRFLKLIWNWFLFWWFLNNGRTNSDLDCRGQFSPSLGRNFATRRWRSDWCWGHLIWCFRWIWGAVFISRSNIPTVNYKEWSWVIPIHQATPIWFILSTTVSINCWYV